MSEPLTSKTLVDRLWECPSVADGPISIATLTDEAAIEINRRGDEIERLQGIRPEMPPRPPEGEGLPRYGIRWNGPEEPLAVPMDDGYWTPWHLATRLQSETSVSAIDHAQRAGYTKECSDCDGTGTHVFPFSTVECKCSRCDGTGVVRVADEPSDALRDAVQILEDGKELGSVFHLRGAIIQALMKLHEQHPDAWPSKEQLAADQAATRDLLLYGTSYERIDANGTRTRIDPATVMVAPQPEDESHE